jgi:hypothetical protein
MGSGDLEMAGLQMHAVIAVAVIVGTLGSVSSLLACLLYPVVQKNLRDSRKELKLVSLTFEGNTINAHIPTEEFDKVLSTMKKYKSNDIKLDNKLPC